MTRVKIHPPHGMRRLRLLALAVIALAASPVAASPPNAASLPLEELQILGKAVIFLKPPLTPNTTVVIVYRTGDIASRRDAESLATGLNDVPLGGGPVKILIVSIEALATTPDYQLIIVAARADDERILAAANAHHALCVTADVDAVLSGHCTMAIRSARKVEIFVNRIAAEQSGIAFTTAFRMMVHEQ